MLHGLLWFPLLGVFIGLAWAGWNEYQKLETYRVWADQFDRAKYDIYSVLGQKGTELTIGKGTRKAIEETRSISLKDVKAIRLTVDGQNADLNSPPKKGKAIALEFDLPTEVVKVPFTQTGLAARWGQVLTIDLQKLNQ